MGVEMHAVDAADLERHVLPDNGVNGMAVGHHRKLLPEIPVMGLLGGRFWTGPTPPLRSRIEDSLGRVAAEPPNVGRGPFAP